MMPVRIGPPAVFAGYPREIVSVRPVIRNSMPSVVINDGTLSPIVISPIALLSKKRKHFLTIGYQDENGKQQAAVFEIGKDTVRVDLATIEARTGRKIEYQDEEARKSGLGN